ncbi:PRC-barrel domain containing protein [Rhodocytophaga rosea]|uniref:PRC-barrel domain containing protein n=1 Tax=Rhodocytophaga rosea TaxID=2704465 RepID=A0A6C0GI78_9BACT|nr:PRC-barrel domain-containing protein [Rhodocytophaga rosea]QHT67430.1 PRC-barrel domain containing protein [Rhodocytophaga rosea]
MNIINLTPSSKMISGKVTDKLGEPYGHITDLLVDPANGKIAMAVLSYGGVLGMGNTSRLIPWEALQMNPNTFDFQISIDKKILEDAPAADASDVTDYKKLTDIFQYYGVPAYWEKNLNFDTTDAVYKEAKVNDHQQYEGSSQISDPRRTPESNNRFVEDVDTDKLEGRPSSQS